MAYALGALSRSRCKHVDPLLLAIYEEALGNCIVDSGFPEEQSRTAAQQQAKVAAGVSKVPPGPKARHMIQPDGFSKAIDPVPWFGGAFTWGDDQWRLHRPDGSVIYPFHELAVCMQTAAMLRGGVPIIWGAVWDRRLEDLPDDVAGLRQAVEDYKARCRARGIKHILLDGPHFELAA